MAGISLVGAIIFSVWIHHAGGKELFYLPIAFSRYGFGARDEVTHIMVKEWSGELDPRRRILLAILPMLLVLLTIALLAWESSRWVTS
jgi:hypothetical protein